MPVKKQMNKLEYDLFFELIKGLPTMDLWIIRGFTQALLMERGAWPNDD